MRNLILLLLLAGGLVSCSQGVKGKNGVVFKTPVDYNDYIVARQRAVIQALEDFAKVADYNLDSAEVLLSKTADKTDRIIEDIKGMPSYKGDTIFRNAAIRSFTFYKEIITTDYKEIIAYRRKGENATTEDQAKIDDIITKLTKKEESLDRAFIRGQEKFAEKNNMTLQEHKNIKEYKDPAN